MAFYLKYRPQTLSDLLGQEVVKKTLLSAFDSKKLSHAYLFVGPRGTGKTSTARILAKMVNCQLSDVSRQSSNKQSLSLDKTKSLKADSEVILTTDDSIPCNKCDSCMSITDGSNLDLIEIDAASNNSVEDIRSLRDKIKLAPTSSLKKIYIIDEVHMLSNSAFNALLKTLEEPPQHALFILATTEAQKIPATILSRTQRLDFKPASFDDIKLGLKKIAKEEKMEIEEEALSGLAKLADGSFRDSVKLLEQLASLNKKIDLNDLSQLLRSTKFETVSNLLGLLSEKKSKEMLLLLNKEIEIGSNAKELTLAVLENLRFLMLIKNGLGEQLVKNNLSEENFEKLTLLSEKFNETDLVKGLDSFQNALEKFKFASIQVLPLELAVMEICSSTVIPANAGIQKTEKQWIPQQVRDDTKIKIATLRQDQGKLPRNDVEEEPLASIKTDTQIPASQDVEKLLEKWNFVLETVRPYNFSLAALLGSVKIVGADVGVVTLEVPYSFHQRILEAPKSKDLLQSVLSDVLEKSVAVSVLLGERPMRVEDIANVEIAADDEIVRMASEIFNGKLVE